MIFRIILMALCMLGILSPLAQAQVFLEQAKVNLAASPGEHLNGSLLIHNTSAFPEEIRVYWEDFKYKSPYDGTKLFLPAGTAPGSASQWVVFSPQTFSVPAYGQQNIDYTVTVPSTMQEGHYGVLFFERGAKTTLNHEEINVVSRIGCLFFIEPKIKSKKALLQDINLKTHSITANFVNQGNIILIPHTTYYIMQNGGMVLERGDAKRLYVPPGVSAPLEIPLKNQLSVGQYTVVINSDLDEGDVLVKEVGLAVDQTGHITIESVQD